MKALALSSAALLIATAGVAAAAELTSGPELDSNAAAYDVLDVTGPNKGKKLCYR